MSLIIRDFAFLENKLITNAADTDWNSRCKSSLDQVKCQCEAHSLIQLFSVCGVRLMQSSCPLFHKKKKKSKTKQDTLDHFVFVVIEWWKLLDGGWKVNFCIWKPGYARVLQVWEPPALLWNPYLTNVFQVFDVDALRIHDFLNHIGSHLLPVLRAVCVSGSWIFLVCYTLHTFSTRVLLIHTHLKHIHHRHNWTSWASSEWSESLTSSRKKYSANGFFFQLQNLK